MQAANANNAHSQKVAKKKAKKRPQLVSERRVKDAAQSVRVLLPLQRAVAVSYEQLL